MKFLTNALLLSFLILSQTACSMFSDTKPIDTVYIMPPEKFFQATEVESFKALGYSTYGDLTDFYVPYLKSQIGMCNKDKEGALNYIRNMQK